MKLITLDLDGTLLPDDTVFAAVLRESGFADEVKASDDAYFAGDITLEECFWQQWDWVKGLSLADCHRALRKAAWLPGISEGVRALKGTGAKVCLLTDQPSILTDYLGRWGLIDAICSPVTIKEGHPVAIDAQFDKLANLKAHCDEWGVELAEVTHVGNGSNDVPVWNAVGRGIAVYAEPEVARHADLDLGRVASLEDVVSSFRRRPNVG